MNKYWLDGVDLPNMRQPPVAALTDFLTPTANVFCLNHMGIPNIDRDRWRITIDGYVETPMTLTLDDLCALPQREVCAFHECAGNPRQPGIPVRRVANVMWRGVAVGDVLALAGVRDGARFVWSTGADNGDYHGIHVPAFVKDLPIEEIERKEVLLALQMNGRDLDDPRGGPVRLVVPGYYGTNSTKWLTGLTVHTDRSPGHFTTVMYNDLVVEGGRETFKPVWRVAPHSIIVAPANEAVLRPGVETLISGWAWAADPIETVEISVDDGANWKLAELSLRRDYSWQRFQLPWTPPAPGRFHLQSRAFDTNRQGQPSNGARNCIFAIKVTAHSVAR